MTAVFALTVLVLLIVYALPDPKDPDLLARVWAAIRREIDRQRERASRRR